MERVDERSRLRSAVSTAAAASRAGTVNVEEYLDGQDLLCISWVQSGRVVHVACLEELTSGPPHFVGLGFRTVGAEGSDDIAAARATQERFCEAFDLDHTLALTAMRAAHGQARVFEVHLELGGDGVCELLQAAAGYDLLDQAVSLATGAPVDAPSDVPRPVAIRFLFQSDTARLGEDGVARAVDAVGGQRIDFPGLAAEMAGTRRVGAVLLEPGAVAELERRLEGATNS
jgi:hypothetical protein